MPINASSTPAFQPLRNSATTAPAAPVPAAEANVAANANATPQRADGFDPQLGQGATPLPASGGLASSPMGIRLGLAPEPQRGLPEELSLAAATIHRGNDPRVVPSTIAVSVWVPMPTETTPGVVLDVNKKTYQERLPHRFVMSDAGLTRAFLGVDKTPGSVLDQKLDEIISRIPTQPDGRRSLDDTAEFLRANVNDIIRWTRGSSANDGRAEFEWDRNINVDQSVWDTFSSVAFSEVGHAPVDSGADYPVVPFENYLDAGEGYCIQKALLAALVLDKLGFGYRLVNGAVDMGPGRTTGHTWVELEDGRVLDTAWNKLAAKGPGQDGFSDRFRYGSSYRFENQTFPYLSLS